MLLECSSVTVSCLQTCMDLYNALCGGPDAKTITALSWTLYMVFNKITQGLACFEVQEASSISDD